jgi:MFS family permease
MAQAIAALGLQMQTIGVNWHIYTLLRDAPVSMTLFGWELNLGALGLGGLGLVRWLPLLIFGLAGGMLADTRNRRHLLIATQVLGAGLALLLAGLTFAGVAGVGVIYAVVAGVTVLAAVENPARESLLPALVPRRNLTNAVSLIALTYVIGTVGGPALGGLLLSRLSLGWLYAVHALTFVPVLLALAWMRQSGPPANRQMKITPEYFLDGFRFTFRTPMIRSTMLVDFFATLLGSARTLLPIVADQVLGVGAGGYGLLATAQPLGSLLAGLFVSLRRDIHRQGWVFLICIAAYGLGTALFGVSTSFVLSYILFATTGAADTTSSIIRGAIRQLWTPDALRGRMVGVNMIFYMGGPQLGEVRAGVVAAVVGAPLAIISGGIAAALVPLWAALRNPGLRNYTGDQGYAVPQTETLVEVGAERGVGATGND